MTPLFKKRNIIRLALTVAGVLIVILLVRYSGASLNQIVESILGVKYYYLIALIALSFTMILFLSLRWERIVKDLTGINPINRGYFLYYSTMGVFANMLVPQVGIYGSRILSLKITHKVPIKIGTLTVLIEQLFDFVILGILTLPALLFFLKLSPLLPSLLLAIVLSITAGIIFGYNRVSVFKKTIQGYAFLYKTLSRLPLIGSKFQNSADEINKLSLINKTNTLRLYLYSYLKYLNQLLRIYIVILALNIKVPFSAVALGYPLTAFLALISITPLSLGPFDMGWFGILMLLGVSRPEIGMFLVTLRVLGQATLVPMLIPAFCYFQLQKRYHHENISFIK